ncbi:heterotrimeric G protein alpha subunit 4 [Desarmillaria tabescens]|uniref:Heterotrimeric G protein alpha subunit 4 n=1 Tax=Armillaria tabescens TaxID=1929756 RepID=A0AA39JC52_ARMTA|nr:heterotrimeric G protein alpha subunit 4 [Desarmillaria tabescens]KAK0440031.1 heterotrimeric G protein alpha subunit 4 [Desarmillaria tabescens]
MGACFSSQNFEVTDADRALHKKAEKELKEAKAKMATQVKVLLLGSGDSGKSTVLKQMRLIYKNPFSPQEVESYRQFTFDNLTGDLKCILDAMKDMNLKVSEDNIDSIDVVNNARYLKDGEPFPMEYLEPIKALWSDAGIRKAWRRGNEAALPENLEYFFSDLDRLFDPQYLPTEQDIIQCRVRTIGIKETVLYLQERELTMVDVGGQKSERRKWIHCFQDVTSILFLVSLSGYDQCLVEDKDANQMQDAMTIWDSVCHSQWFKNTSVILFLNKNDLFEKKIPHSDIRNFFPDFDGERGDVRAGRDYFKRRFMKLATNTGRKIYIHITTAIDTAMLRPVMATVEGTLRHICSIVSGNVRISLSLPR